MTKLRIKILKTKIKLDKLKCYMQCEDDRLLLAKEDFINYELDKFNSFHNILKFIMNRFKGKNAHVLGITIDKTDTHFIIKPGLRGNNLISAVEYLKILKPHGRNHFIAVK